MSHWKDEKGENILLNLDAGEPAKADIFKTFSRMICSSVCTSSTFPSLFMFTVLVLESYR